MLTRTCKDLGTLIIDTSPRAKIPARTYLESRDMQAKQDPDGAKPTHRSFSTGDQKRIDYVFVSNNINTKNFETMTDMPGRSDHYPLRVVFSFDVRDRPQEGGQNMWSMAKGWKPKNVAQYHARMRRAVTEASSFDELVLSMEVSARAEAPQKPRGPHSEAEAEVSRLMRCRRTASTAEDKRKVTCELHKARSLAKQERVERGRLQAARSGAVQVWRESRRAPQSLPRVFEQSDCGEEAGVAPKLCYPSYGKIPWS